MPKSTKSQIDSNSVKAPIRPTQFAERRGNLKPKKLFSDSIQPPKCKRPKTFCSMEGKLEPRELFPEDNKQSFFATEQNVQNQSPDIEKMTQKFDELSNLIQMN